MPQRLLIDTDVLIDLLRGQADAIAFLSGLTDPPLVSAVTVAVLYAGGLRGGHGASGRVAVHAVQ